MVNDLVLAFYAEIAEFINQDADMAATARSVELPFDELQSVVVIRQYADYSKTPAHSGNIKVVTIQGRMEDNENIIFVIHMGYATTSLPSRRPYRLDGDMEWIDLETVKRSGVRITFRYNLFDRPGFCLLCEWAMRQSREWLMR